MPLFLMQTRVSADGLQQPKSLHTLERHVADRIAEHPQVWPSFKKLLAGLPAVAPHGKTEQ